MITFPLPSFLSTLSRAELLLPLFSLRSLHSLFSSAAPWVSKQKSRPVAKNIQLICIDIFGQIHWFPFKYATFLVLQYESTLICFQRFQMSKHVCYALIWFMVVICGWFLHRYISHCDIHPSGLRLVPLYFHSHGIQHWIITVQHLSIIENSRLAKKDNFILLKWWWIINLIVLVSIQCPQMLMEWLNHQFKTFSINSIPTDVNGMTQSPI